MSKLQQIINKIATKDKAIQIVEKWKSEHKTIVFTNGCFDILHKGHVTYLAKAAEFGNKLIIGLNTDESIKQQGKGDERPINSEDARLFVLASLDVVDLVILFNDQTPIDLIETLLPTTLVKGADYDENENNPLSKKYIIGSDVVRANGGNVKTVDLEEGYSTTSLISKIKD